MERKSSFELIEQSIISVEEDDTIVKALEEVGSLTETFYIATTEKNRSVKFLFEGLYENKKERVSLLKQSFLNLGLSGKNVEVKPCFLSNSVEVNSFETESIIRALKGKYFYFIVKFFHLQKKLREVMLLEDRINIISDALTWTLPEFFSAGEYEKDKKDRRLRLLGAQFQLKCSKVIWVSVVRAANVLSKIDEYEENCLWDMVWSTECNRARYRLLLHILENVSDENKMLEIFLLRHKIRESRTIKQQNEKTEQEHKRQRECTDFLEKETVDKKIKITSFPQKAVSLTGYLEDSESSNSDDTVPTETEENFEIITEQEEVLPEPVFTEVTRERRRNAEPEIESHTNSYHFRGPKRWSEVQKAVKDRHEKLLLSKKQKKAWLTVFFAGIAIFVWTILIDFDIVPMVGYNIYKAHDTLASFAIVFIGIMLTCRNEQKWSNIVLFILFCFLSLWVGKGRRKEFKFPALSYACCSLTVLLCSYEKKWILAIPATGFIIALALGFHFSLFDIFSRCCMLFFTATSFFVEFRKKECKWHKILVSPIRDICFVLLLPFYLIVQCSG